MDRYEVIVFYMEILVHFDYEEASVISVSSDEDECFEKGYAAIVELEKQGHTILIEEVRFGIL